MKVSGSDEEWVGGSVADPSDIYLFKVINKNTGTMHEICSKLTIKTLERRQGQCFY